MSIYIALNIKSKFVDFKLIETKPKTNVYGVYTKEKTVQSGVTPQPILLGVIKFYPNWRQYSFFPEYETVFEKTCMQDITNFMIALNKDLRESQKQRRKQNNSI